MDTTESVDKSALFYISAFHKERPIFHFVTAIEPSLTTEAVGSCFAQAIETCKDTDYELSQLTFVVSIR